MDATQYIYVCALVIHSRELMGLIHKLASLKSHKTKFDRGQVRAGKFDGCVYLLSHDKLLDYLV